MQNYFSIQLLRVVKSSLWLTSKKIPRTMRLFILFLICSMSFVHATDSFAQKVEISIDAQNQTVEKVLKEIEKQSGFGFFFNNKHVNLKRVVSVSVDKSNIFKVLDKIFEGTDVKYSVLDKKIILSTEMTSKQQQAVKISGKVVDVNGEPVIGASIVEKGTTNGTVTNLQGDFSLSVSFLHRIPASGTEGHCRKTIECDNERRCPGFGRSCCGRLRFTEEGERDWFNCCCG